ncbi:hypothetical protein HanRHA438_Chr16g0772741 [Helianthus annuus]|nr:hypothetical protein HanRHA438_Chr16g0772741 [Helianthus annuus]
MNFYLYLLLHVHVKHISCVSRLIKKKTKSNIRLIKKTRSNKIYSNLYFFSCDKSITIGQ